MNITNILADLKQERERISHAIAALESIAGSAQNSRGTRRKAGASTGPRTVSLAARRRMAKAQRARWAKVKSQSRPAAPKLTHVKRTMSASARRKIAAAQRARWAKLKKAA